MDRSSRAPRAPRAPRATRLPRRALAALVLAAAGAAPAAADAAILLDFGNNAPANTTNSPAHAAGAVPAAEDAFNVVKAANPTSLVNSDGTAAAGVTLTLGRTLTSGSNTVDFTCSTRTRVMT